MKIATLFSGIEGVGVGARAAGLDLTWGIESNAKAAAIANQNLGDHVRVIDILDTEPAQFESVDVLHASPPCPSFSQAKKDAVETGLDIALASKVAEFIGYHTPKFFTLENVWGYRKSQSWAIIGTALTNAGYWHTVDNVNSADFGVPQTRKRMIVRAVRSGWIPMLPQPERWVGWHEAIEDLIPELPETEFASWQLRILPQDVKTWLFGNQVMSEKSGISRKPAELPAQTITAENSYQMRAYLFGNQKDGDKSYINHAKQGSPSQTITLSNSTQMRAFVVDGGGNDRMRTVTTRAGKEPYMTVTEHSDKHTGRVRVEQGRVVKITVPCLMRFQSFPDLYKGATSRGIGNSVPPLMYQKIIHQLIDCNEG